MKRNIIIGYLQGCALAGFLNVIMNAALRILSNNEPLDNFSSWAATIISVILSYTISYKMWFEEKTETKEPKPEDNTKDNTPVYFGGWYFCPKCKSIITNGHSCKKCDEKENILMEVDNILYPSCSTCIHAITDINNLEICAKCSKPGNTYTEYKRK
jgi:hypothetical protein